jgi:hypothetical protein
MNESHWLRGTDPTPLLEFLRDSGQLSERKARLFAAACCRGIWDLIRTASARRAVEASEAYVDGRIRWRELAELRERARREEADLAQWAVMASSRPRVAAGWVAHLAADARNRPGTCRAYAPSAKPSPEQCGHLRDLFGPLPFRPVPVARPVLRWNSGTVVKLAEAAYQDRHLPEGTLDSNRLVVLADALEEAGCDEQDFFNHLRGPGPHVRGCWALDVVLGKS